jgi:PAS domain S-box-containing protein
MTTDPVQEKSFRQLLAAAADALLVVDARGNVVALNPEAERLFGWSEAEMLGESLDRLIPSRFRQLIEPQLASDGESPGIPLHGTPVSLFARRRDGTEFPVEFTRSPLAPSQDALVLVTLRDLTKWRRAQETLFREKEQAFGTLASIADAVITTDLAGTITYLNPMGERLTGWRTTEALGQPLGTVVPLISDETRQPIESIPARCLREGRAVDLADGVLLLRRDGTEVPIGDSAAPLRDRNGATIGVVLVFHDVTERRRVTRSLSHEATHDPLTGLVSRKEFERRLARVLAEITAGTVEHALCYLDLDRFKLVNDSCGHEAGDELLKTVGRGASAETNSACSWNTVRQPRRKKSPEASWRRSRTSPTCGGSGASRSAPASASSRSRPRADKRLTFCAPPTMPATLPRTREATASISRGQRRPLGSSGRWRADESRS